MLAIEKNLPIPSYSLKQMAVRQNKLTASNAHIAEKIDQDLLMVALGLPSESGKIGYTEKYPFTKMEVGDSFYIHDPRPRSADGAASSAAKLGIYIATRRDKNGVRVWRIKPDHFAKQREELIASRHRQKENIKKIESEQFAWDAAKNPLSKTRKSKKTHYIFSKTNTAYPLYSMGIGDTFHIPDCTVKETQGLYSSARRHGIVIKRRKRYTGITVTRTA